LNDETLIAFLLSFPGVNQLAGQRGYPYGLLPQKTTGQVTSTLPAFTVSGISEISHHAIGDGGRPETSCFRRWRYQVDVYAESGAAVARLSDAIRFAADGFTGKASSTIIGGVWLRLTTPIEREPETELYRRSLDFEIHTV
jgi:hypothetical protein